MESGAGCGTAGPLLPIHTPTVYISHPVVFWALCMRSWHLFTATLFPVRATFTASTTSPGAAPPRGIPLAGGALENRDRDMIEIIICRVCSTRSSGYLAVRMVHDDVSIVDGGSLQPSCCLWLTTFASQSLE